MKVKNKKIGYTIIGIAAVILVTIGITYAYWLITKNQTGENLITSACLDISLTNEENDIELTNQFPLSDADGMKLTPYEFTVTNNCNTSVDYHINLESLGTESETIIPSAIKVMLDENTPQVLSDSSEKDITIEGAYESRLLGTGTLSAKDTEGSSASHSLRIWIDEDAPISEMNKTFRSKISVTIGQGIEVDPIKPGTLAYNIISNYGGEDVITRLDLKWVQQPFDPNEIVLTMNISDSYYWGTKTVFDETSGFYQLDGLIVKATVTECRAGKKSDGTTISCGNYTLNRTTNSQSREAFLVTSFTNDKLTDTNQKSYITVKAAPYSLSPFASINDGLYKTKDDLGDSYVFRGNVENNYVKFGKVQNVYTPSNVNTEVIEAIAGTEASSMWKATFESMAFSTEEECIAAPSNELGSENLWTECEEQKEIMKLYSYNGAVGILGILGFTKEQSCIDFFGVDSCNEIMNVETGKQMSMYWRIIRINGDGTIRMLFDGFDLYENKVLHFPYIASTSYDEFGNIGYTYDDGTGNQVDSTIKGVVDAWYTNYLKQDYGQYIADSIFCNDREILTASDSEVYYAASTRIDNTVPTLKCINKEDRYTVSNEVGNKLLAYPIGLMTADELVLTTVYGFTDPSAEGFWTMTPYSSILNEGNYYGSVYNRTRDYSHLSPRDSSNYGYDALGDKYSSPYPYYARPVINLKADVLFTGTGTIDDPYIIVTD